MYIPHTVLKTVGLCSLLCGGGLLNYAQAQPPERLTEDEIEARRAPIITPAALQQTLGGPTLLSLHEKEATPQATFDDLAKQAEQAGIKVRLPQPHQKLQVDQPVTVDLAAQPFWQVLRAVTPKLGLYTYPWGQQEGITLATWSNGESAGLEQATWPCLFVAHKLERTEVYTQMLDGKQPALKNASLALSLTAYLDPKVHLITRRSSLRLDEVVDEKGHSLIDDKSIALNSYGNGFAPSFYEISPSLTQPPGLGKRIARFKGTFRLVVIAKQEAWEIPDVLNAKEVSKTANDKTFTFLSLEKRGENYVAHFRVSSVIQTPGAPDGAEAFNGVKLLDAQGHEYDHRNAGFNGSEQGMVANIMFTHPEMPEDDKTPTPSGEPVKLIWTYPTQMRTVEVPFEFDNLPLP